MSYPFNPFKTGKNQLAQIFTKFIPQHDHFSWILKLQKVLQYLFLLSRYRENIGLQIFFNSAHFLILFFFRAKSSVFSPRKLACMQS